MKRPRPDNRLDWRDPEMPVYRGYVMPSGQKKEWVDPDYERRYREHLIKQATDDYRRDPTYNLRRKK